MNVVEGNCIACDANVKRGVEIQPAGEVEPTAFVLCIDCSVKAVVSLDRYALTPALRYVNPKPGEPLLLSYKSLDDVPTTVLLNQRVQP